MKWLYLVIVSVLLFVINSDAQENTIPTTTLHLRGIDGTPVDFAAVQIRELRIAGLTDSLGIFKMPLPAGKYHLSVSRIGYQPIDTVVEINSKNRFLNLQLKNNNKELQSVQITGETHGALLNLNPIKASVINTLDSKEQPVSLVDLINRSSGIRIRQTGTLGSSSDVNINGFQGRSIRYFKDGLPLDYLGEGFSLSLIPVDMLDHVEVYKGVLPVYLGADALGGAVNLVTRKSAQSYADFSYEYGSFNTHRISVNTEWFSKSKKVFLGLNGFYNYTKGNYKVDVQTPNAQTGVLEDITTQLIHNRFSNYYVEGFAGVQDVSWADEFKVMLSGFGLKKQFPFGATMFKPFGQTHGEQESIIPSFLYKKEFLKNILQVSLFGEVNTLDTKIIDTAHGHYDWYGNFTPNSNEHGEITDNGSLAQIKYRYLTTRGNIVYQLSDHQSLDFNMVVGDFRRTGSDKYGRKFPDGEDFLSRPATYNKMVMALGLKSDFIKSKIENNLILKSYGYTTKASDLTVTGNPETVDNHNHQWGIADGLKIRLSQSSLIQLSVESALRLPEQDEIFGDGNVKLANFDLIPERSLNFNLGFQSREAGKYRFEVNSFFRRTKNMILLVPVYFLNSQSQNIEDVRGIGLDMDAGYFISPWLEATGNLTYQDLRLIHSANPNRELSRLRNTPYFFSNLGLNAHLKKLFRKNDRIDFYWYYSFVRQFYLDYIPKSVEPSGFLGLWGNAKIDAGNIIPNQSSQTIGFTYHPLSRPITFGFQVRNLLNAMIYDNFRVQNPGRSYSIKISYSIL